MNWSRLVRVGAVAMAFLAVIFASAGSGSGDVVVSTFDTWTGSVFSQLGEQPSVQGTDATYGQTLTPPITAPMLKQFSVWLSDTPITEPDPLDFRGYLMEWTGYSAAGPVLFESTTQTVSTAHGETRRFDLGPIDTMLDPAKQYVFFLSCSLLFDGVDSWAWVGGQNADVYNAGYFVTLNNQNDFSKVYSTEWLAAPGADLTFEAIFDVPEPGAAMALAPLVMLAASRRRRRR